MKLPRFTLRWLMVVVAIVAWILAFLMSTKGAYWVGSANIPLRFTILDDASGRPISQAIVRLPGDTVYEATPTGDDGKTTVVIRVMCSGRVSILRKTRDADFSSWHIRVVAPGYRTFTGSLENRRKTLGFTRRIPTRRPS